MDKTNLEGRPMSVQKAKSPAQVRDGLHSFSSFEKREMMIYLKILLLFVFDFGECQPNLCLMSCVVLDVPFRVLVVLYHVLGILCNPGNMNRDFFVSVFQHQFRLLGIYFGLVCT